MSYLSEKTYLVNSINLNNHKKNPLTYRQFITTDFENLTKFTEEPIDDIEISFKFYIYYLCIVGNTKILKDNLNFALIELDRIGLNLDCILNTNGADVSDMFENMSLYDVANMYNTDNQLNELLINFGAKKNLFNTTYSPQSSSKFGAGITYCTDDNSDNASIMFDKRCYEATSNELKCPFLL